LVALVALVAVLAAVFLVAFFAAFFAVFLVAFLAAFLAAFLVAFFAVFLLARGSNSKPTLPFLMTRKALNLRCVRLETKPSSRSVLPSASILVICSGLTSCWRMILPERKSQVFSGPTAFSQT